MEDDITTRANSMAYSFFIALFPAIIFLFTLIAYLPIANSFLPAMQGYIQQAMPTKAGDFLFNMIIDIVEIQRGGLLSFGIILAIFFASNGMLSMMRGFDKSYPETFKDRNIFQKRWVAILLTLISAVLLLFSMTLLVVGTNIFEWLTQMTSLDAIGGGIIFGIVRFIIVVLTIYTLITIIYRIGPAFRRRMSWLTPGATLATSLTLISSLAFSWFVNTYGQYNQLYGALGALIVILLWIQINCFIILVGFELNASIRVNRDLRSVKEG